MKKDSEYYVYVYIDPRNFEEFYYGKGTGDRKSAHLGDKGDSEKAKRIKEIQKAGLKPIIKVIVKDLTEREAFLIEKTLIWKLGRTLTNVSSGHFADKFRPHNTMHKDLFGFDYQNGIYFFNVDERSRRSWADRKKYGFLSAGGGKKWGEQIRSLHEGDVVVAYLGGKGYVGVGVVTQEAVKAKEFKVRGKKLDELNLISTHMLENIHDPEKTEYLVKVHWKSACDPGEAKWDKNKGLFAARMAKASLQNQRATLDFIEHTFKVDFDALLKKE